MIQKEVTAWSFARSAIGRHIVLLASACLLGAAAQGAVIYDESVSGDLSNSGLTPTVLTVSLGSNQVFGTTGKTTAIDRDYFTFTVPVGEVLSSLTLLPGTQTLGTLGESFIGVEAGPQVTVLTSATNAIGLLGWFHYGVADIGTDILPAIGSAGLGATDFTAPLPAGTYSFWVQEASAGTVQYGLDFGIAATPEPGSWALLLSGMLALGARAMSRRHSKSGQQPQGLSSLRWAGTWTQLTCWRMSYGFNAAVLFSTSQNLARDSTCWSNSAWGDLRVQRLLR